MSEETADERITALEIHLMHQERLLQELNEVVTAQQDRIDRLLADVALLKAQLMIVAPSVQKDPADETPPPHY